MVYGALKAGVDFISQSGTKNLVSEKEDMSGEPVYNIPALTSFMFHSCSL
jgi:hypothetical protein